MTNSINWKKREVIKESNDAYGYYRYTYYKVPYKGTFNASKMKEALNERYKEQFLGYFGGQTYIGEVSDLGNGFAEVEWAVSVGH